MRDRESLLGRMEERLSRVSGWLAERRHGDQAGARDLHLRADALRRGIGRTRRSLAEIARDDLARVRATLDDLRTDYDVPPPHFAPRHDELDAFRRHLEMTARLLGTLSDVDDPRWEDAHEAYERSWDEVERLGEAGGEAASP